MARRKTVYVDSDILVIGGGFGGCVIALLHKEELQDVIQAIADEYTPGAEIAPTIYDFKISDGAYASEYVIKI